MRNESGPMVLFHSILIQLNAGRVETFRQNWWSCCWCWNVSPWGWMKGARETIENKECDKKRMRRKKQRNKSTWTQLYGETQDLGLQEPRLMNVVQGKSGPNAPSLWGVADQHLSESFPCCRRNPTPPHRVDFHLAAQSSSSRSPPHATRFQLDGKPHDWLL